jgi:nondiscriminating aspartyl-tRNA synthetase
MQRILSSDLPHYIGQHVLLQGWLHNLRQLGEVNFLLLRDRAGLAQAVLSGEAVAELAHTPVESIITMQGTVIEAPPAPGGYELQNVTVEVLNPSTDVPPIELNKRVLKASLPTFLDHAVVGHRHPHQRAILKIAAGVMQGFREVLTQHDFTEIQTPKLVGSATESGANVYAVDHFGQTAYLAQSPQFYKQMMVGVFERVFEIGPVFRAEKHATRRHINEYVSMDVEFGFIEDHFTVMEMVTQVITGILEHLTTCHTNELTLLKAEMPGVAMVEGKQLFPHIHFDDAQNLLRKQFGFEDTLGAPDLTPEHERQLGAWALAEHGSDFLFVTGYPMKKRPFYTHPDPERLTFSNSFDLLFRGTELITGGQRLHVYQDYLDAIAAIGHTPAAYETYLEAFKYGMPPHGGFAIGMERFVMQLLQLDNIRRATLFPRDMNRLTP